MRRVAREQASVSRTNLVQFWASRVAPPEVEEVMASWQADSAFVYHRYCWESAYEFLRDRFDRRTLKVFEACAVPAMQCDVFRLYWLFERGGVYIDADMKNNGHSKVFTDRSVRGHLFRKMPRRRTRPGKREKAPPRGVADDTLIVNGLMSFFEPHDPLLAEVMERVTSNVERRIDGDVWGVTGPGVITRVFRTLGPDHALFDGIRIHPVGALSRVVRSPQFEYKSAASHWQNVAGSIYNSPGPT